MWQPCCMLLTGAGQDGGLSSHRRQGLRNCASSKMNVQPPNLLLSPRGELNTLKISTLSPCLTLPPTPLSLLLALLYTLASEKLLLLSRNCCIFGRAQFLTPFPKRCSLSHLFKEQKLGLTIGAFATATGSSTIFHSEMQQREGGKSSRAFQPRSMNYELPGSHSALLRMLSGQTLQKGFTNTNCISVLLGKDVVKYTACAFLCQGGRRPARLRATA